MSGRAGRHQAAGLTGTAPTGFTQKPPMTAPMPISCSTWRYGRRSWNLSWNLTRSGTDPSPAPSRRLGLSYDAFNLNQRAVADAIIGYFLMPMAVKFQPPSANSMAGLSQASGEPAAGAISAGIRSADLFLDLISDQALAGRGTAG